jgi:imidazoleglycerol phosphate dehydratase HisB
MEGLILQLNDPRNQGSPDQIHSISKQLQILQRQKSSWQRGLDFLQHQNPTIRFYGALTLTVKINADWYLTQTLLWG